MLKIFNTLTRKKEKFKPINNNNTVNIYVCGATVYDLCHIGHARTFLIFDFIVRYLRYCGYQVNYVRNITDIDDKIINKAYINNETIENLTNRMILGMHKDFKNLGMLKPNHEPRVTEYIKEIIKFICILINKKHAYIASNGDVLFSIETIKNYGCLSQKLINTLSVSNKKNFSDIKKNLSDFVLWKVSKPGEPKWSSPWGLGRPGWHIECSTICFEILGKYIDIHGGGIDLIFPHHENEIVQSVYKNDSPFVKIWIHTGMLLFNSKKMSKSLNNTFTIRNILKNYDAETIRYFLMSAHYRNSLKYTEDSLQQAHRSLTSLYIALRDIKINTFDKPSKENFFISKFISKINDDFNIPEAYAILFDIAHKLNFLKINNHSKAKDMAIILKYLGNILGLLNQDPEFFLQKSILNNNYDKEKIKIIKILIEHREIARKKHQWDLADKIRKKLSIMGIILEDKYTGNTKWYFKKN